MQGALVSFSPFAASLESEISEPKSVSSPARPKALFILDAASCDLIFGKEERRDLEQRADFYAPPQTRESVAAHPELLSDVEVIFSGWGAPKMDQAFLDAAPNLRAVFYGAGTIGYFTSEAFWDREIVVTSAYGANAAPVAEFTLSVILLSLKHFWRAMAAVKTGGGWGDHTRDVPGGFRSTVALIGCGMIARRVIELLKPFDLRCIVCDPFLSGEKAASLGVELCTLDEVFTKADVVSVHAPQKDSTIGMVTGELLSKMKPGATFINTARPLIVRQEEMIEALRQRPDLTAILDVSDPEPQPEDSPLVTLPNVVLTPHMAGSLGPECQRLGHYMVEEFKRYQAGEPLRWQITRELAPMLA